EDRVLSGDPLVWKQVEVNFEEASKIYQDAGDDAAVVREALRVRDEALADLPYLSRWLADRHVTAVSDADSLTKDTQAHLALWEAVHKLTTRLQVTEFWIRGVKPRDISELGEHAPVSSLKDQVQI